MERFWPRLFARLAKARRQRTDDEFPLDVLYAQGDEDVEMSSYYIRSRRFGRRLFGGLKTEEVTAFLDEVAEALHTARTRQRSLEGEVQALTINQASVAPSAAFNGAEREATSIIRQDEQTDRTPAASRLEVLRTTALQEVEALLHDAQARAQALTDAAHERAAHLLCAAAGGHPRKLRCNLILVAGVDGGVYWKVWVT